MTSNSAFSKALCHQFLHSIITVFCTCTQCWHPFS